MNESSDTSKLFTWVAIGCGGALVLALTLGCLGALFFGFSVSGPTTIAAPAPTPAAPLPR